MDCQRNVLAYLEEDVRRHPEKCAVEEEDRRCSYGELLELSQRAGSGLAAFGAQHRAVMIFMEKGIDALAVMMGALQAGGFYVPVDPHIPAERLALIAGVLEDPIVVVSEETLPLAQAALEGSGAKLTLAADLLSSSVDSEALAAARAAATDADPVYVLFTSGSTGVPKGVAVSHRAVIDFIDDFVARFGFGEDERIANQAPFDFDVSVKDIYGALATGSTLVVVPRALFSAPAALMEYLAGRDITNMTWAVAALCLITSLHGLDGHSFPTVRRVLFSGEVMPISHLRAWMAAVPQATFVNLYGPTEITCNCLYHVVDPAREYPDGLPLGVPFAHREILLVDGEGRAVTEPGAEGEILVRGDSLALGYVANPAKTAEVFCQNPLHNRFPDRVYRTGDLAAFDEAGELFYKGRIDNQIKHQGHRIELEEVDRALEGVPGVLRCRCVYDHDKQRLIAFYEGEAEARAIRDHVLQTLPIFMLPSKILPIEAMPLTKNGKVDRRALLEKSREAAAARKARLATRKKDQK
ncbi:MAG: D-alanine--poly(phosphoribitol) ligase [Eggerthellaceae bacterium]|nr:D-alanine--poly(phosphoribitol) ligase [Eggerthellaceae bacterium]